jgi:hypothetical protein
MFVPLQALPAVLQWVGFVTLPTSSGIDPLGAGPCVISTRTVLALPYAWEILLGQVVLCGLLAQLTVRRLERTARDQGLPYL